jgi:hypothetical protein
VSSWQRVVPCHDQEAVVVAEGWWRCRVCGERHPDHRVWWQRYDPDTGRRYGDKQLRDPVKPVTPLGASPETPTQRENRARRRVGLSPLPEKVRE